MTSVSYSDESLLREMFNRATTNTTEGIDEFAVCMFCNLIRNNNNFVEKATELLSNKINQACENAAFIPESLQSLALLEECMAKCGQHFQNEVSKYRFLNKLIELVSINHLADKTPQKVQDKIMDCLLLWTTQYPEKEKIKAAYDMLLKQGVQHAPPSIRTERASFIDDENTEKLKKLLQSSDREDIKKANLLIQYHVNQDAKKSERIIRQKSELKDTVETIDLFNQILDNFIKEGTEDNDLYDVIKELYEYCTKKKSIINKMPEIMEDSETDLISETIAVNDKLLHAIERYKEIFNKDAGAACGNAAAKAEYKSDDLLSVFLDKSQQLVPSENEKVENLKSPFEELHEIFSLQSINKQQNLDSAMGVDHAFKSLSILEPTPAYKIDMPTTSAASSILEPINQKDDVLLTIDNISDNLFKDNLKTAERFRKFQKEKVKISLNELAQDKINPNVIEPEHKDESDDLPSIDITKPHVPVLVGKIIDEQPTKIKTFEICHSEDEEIISDPPKSADSDLKNIAPKNGKIIHLSDIEITLNDVEPSNLEPIVVKDEIRGMKIVLNFAADKPTDNVSVIVISSINQSTMPIEDFQFDASAPKPCKLRLLTPTGRNLPGVKPFRAASEDLQQIMLLFNPTNAPVDITCIISYKLGDDPDPIKELVIAKAIPN